MCHLADGIAPVDISNVKKSDVNLFLDDILLERKGKQDKSDLRWTLTCMSWMGQRWLAKTVGKVRSKAILLLTPEEVKYSRKTVFFKSSKKEIIELHEKQEFREDLSGDRQQLEDRLIPRIDQMWMSINSRFDTVETKLNDISEKINEIHGTVQVLQNKNLRSETGY